MATWKKHFQYIPLNQRNRENNSNNNYSSPAQGSKFSSYLPEVYAGQPQRKERYAQYEIMDSDPEINASLDTIAEFSTQVEEQNNTPFTIKFLSEITETEATIIYESLNHWNILNKFNQRIFSIFRNTLKYGDQFFIRDPETLEWYWCDPAKIQSVIVNQAKGKKPEYYVINDLDLNTSSLVATTPPPALQQTTGLVARSPGPLTYSYPRGDTSLGRYISSSNLTSYVAGDSIVHVSLSDGMDNNWPFGNSILESIFKVYKQKELLEDSIIIYRVQRAPERRVFYIDVGNMPTHKAMAFIERVKNEIHQRRIPNRTGGGTSIMDATYNPLSILEDFFFATTSEGRGSKVETLPGGDQLGQIDDLLYFDNKLKRGLRIPSSYLPGGAEDGNTTYTDGRVGTAYIQEYRFAKFCKRLQQTIQPIFDEEFKYYLKATGINIDTSSFMLEFNEPQSFSKFRQIEIDTAQINVFQPLSDVSYLSKRFLLKRFLNMSEKEILENEKLWKEENYSDLPDENKDSEQADINISDASSSQLYSNDYDMIEKDDENFEDLENKEEYIEEPNNTEIDNSQTPSAEPESDKLDL